jgi:hypothetical protein
MNGPFAEFVALFGQLKSDINSSPKNLEWIAKERPTVAELASRVHDTAQRVARVELTLKEQVLIDAPKHFARLWAEYRRQYQIPVERVAEKHREQWKAQITSLLKKKLDLLMAQGKSENEAWQEILKRIGLEWEPDKEEFPEAPDIDPTSEDLVQVIRHGLDKAWDWGENAHTMGYTEDFLEIRKGKLALETFERLVGVNLEEIERRWRRLPVLFWSNKEEISVTSKPIAAMRDRLQEAARAFVFGNTCACIVLCRSLTELILETFYGATQMELAQKIDFAEKRYPQLRKFQLKNKKDMANKILHRFHDQIDATAAGRARWEELAVRYLSDVTSMIENIPSKTTPKNRKDNSQ